MRSSHTRPAHPRLPIGAWLLVLAVLVFPARPAAADEPARLAGGPLPVQSTTVVGWEQATADLNVDAAGAVTGVTLLESTPGFDEAVTSALKGWTFKPATSHDRPVPAVVFVAIVYRPPVLYNAPTLGQQPRRLGAPSADAPYAMSTVTPMYPVQAVGDARVVVEVHVGADGTVDAADVRGAGSGFDAGAVAAAKQWRFRPARLDGNPAEAYAYVVFGFRQPVRPGRGPR